MSFTVNNNDLNRTTDFESAEPLFKKNKDSPPPKRSYDCTPVLDMPARINCLIATKSLDQIESTGEFPDIKNIFSRVRAFNFEELEDGPIESPDHIRCKLQFLKAQKIVLIKAPSKMINENQKVRKVRPLQEKEGNQRKLRPLIGVTKCGKILNLIQLSSNTEGSEHINAEKLPSRIDFEEKMYVKFPKDHDTSPFPITVCILRERENGSETQIRKLKLIQRRESMDLLTLLQTNKDLNFADALKIALDILQALYFCHDRMKIVVADIKPDNVLINLDDKTARLTDFGLSYFAEGANVSNEFAGTPRLFPECFQDCLDCRLSYEELKDKILHDPNRSFARDIWPMGYTLTLLLFHTLPKCIYNLDNANDSVIFSNIFNKILTGLPNPKETENFFKRFALPPFSPGQINTIKSIDDPYKEKRIKALDLITQMFNFDPLKRPTAESLVNQFYLLVND